MEDSATPDGKTKQEMVIMVGFPGAGKSTYAKEHFGDAVHHYTILHGDVLKTEARMKKSLITELDKGLSVVLDATNSSRKKRQVFIKIAKDKNIFIRIIHITTSMEQSMIQNKNRAKDNVRGGRTVPNVAFYVYRKNFEEPSTDEGADILCTN